jgi:flagellar motor switch protein FliN/FliY
MTVTPTAVQTDAVEALLDLLPTTTRLRAQLCSGAALAGRVGEAALASFVGATSADLALVLADPASLDSASGADSALVSRQDVLRPALEGAAGVFGIGVLGDTRPGDATALFADDAASVFELTGDGQVTGWFAVRLRDNGASGGAARAAQSVAGKLGRINSVQMALTVEIGHTRMSVRDVLSLEPGAVIELDRSAGAPADVLLNGRLIAHGEIVVVDQDYAVRITQILDVAESLT